MSQSQNYKYVGVDVVLFDPNVSMRRLIRSSLHAIGFKSVRECRNIDDMIGALTVDESDLLIVDLDSDTERVCRVIQNIRHGEIGRNPFIVIVALTWHPERDVIDLTLTAGTDDVVTKPVSAKVLKTRFDNLIRNRREFVVTVDYVGPERRARPQARPSDLPSLKVPNTLRSKATGESSEAVDADLIKRTMRTVKIQKVYRIANRLATKAMELEERATRNNLAPIPRHYLHGLADLVGTANEYIVAEDMEHLSGIGASMMTVMDNIFDSSFPTPRQFEILRLHGHAIVASVRGDEAAALIVAQALETAAGLLKTKAVAGGRR